ncbi:hypothetical protein DFH27DRAFT_617894 [Peziza echinospora]|nr:hypothetical protein DFH27DRAFT_617894 [Peziza echinospora]
MPRKAPQLLYQLLGADVPSNSACTHNASLIHLTNAPDRVEGPSLLHGRDTGISATGSLESALGTVSDIVSTSGNSPTTPEKSPIQPKKRTRRKNNEDSAPKAPKRRKYDLDFQINPNNPRHAKIARLYQAIKEYDDDKYANSVFRKMNTAQIQAIKSVKSLHDKATASQIQRIAANTTTINSENTDSSHPIADKSLLQPPLGEGLVKVTSNPKPQRTTTRASKSAHKQHKRDPLANINT